MCGSDAYRLRSGYVTALARRVNTRWGGPDGAKPMCTLGEP